MKNYFFSLIFWLLAAGCDNTSHNLGHQQVPNDTVTHTTSASFLQSDITTLEKIRMTEKAYLDAEDFKIRIRHIDVLDSLSDRLTRHDERAATWLKAGQLYKEVSCYEAAERVLIKAQNEAEAMNGDEGLGMMAYILLAMGQNRIALSDFATATRWLTEAGSYFDEKKDYANLIKVYDAQATSYLAQLVFTPADKRSDIVERANYFLEKLSDLQPKIEDPALHVICLTALTNYALNNEDYETAKGYLQKLDSISRSCNYAEGLIFFYGSSGFIAEKTGNLEEGMALYYKSYEAALEARDMNSATKALANAAFDAGQLGEYELIRNYSHRGVQLAKEHGIKSQLWRFLDNLSLIAAQVDGDYKQALIYRNQCIGVYTDIYSENNANQINQYAARFESLQKENQIKDLQSEAEIFRYKSRQKNQLIFFLVLVVVLMTIIFLYRRRLSNKQEQIARQRIQQLEQEKQLIATQSLLDGETRERSRLARDLHDGLGSILASAKINLLKMKKGATLEYASLESYDAAIGLIDKSMSEMRRVAHHLMPEALTAVGLKQSTADFVASIPNATFSYYGDESRFDPKLEETIYRITHELVTNALRHSGAAQILVDIVRYDNRVTLAVQDDGCGFDPDAAHKGMGMNNIRTRIDAFGGNLTIVSKPNVGTEVNVEFEL